MRVDTGWLEWCLQRRTCNDAGWQGGLGGLTPHLRLHLHLHPPRHSETSVARVRAWRFCPHARLPALQPGHRAIPAIAVDGPGSYSAPSPLLCAHVSAFAHALAIIFHLELAPRDFFSWLLANPASTHYLPRIPPFSPPDLPDHPALANLYNTSLLLLPWCKRHVQAYTGHNNVSGRHHSVIGIPKPGSCSLPRLSNTSCPKLHRALYISERHSRVSYKGSDCALQERTQT